mgnify:CR=1 FL=1
MDETNKTLATDCIYLKNGEFFYKYLYSEIYYIAVSGRCCNIYLSPDKTIKLPLPMTLTELIDFLPLDIFIRTHRSYIVNIQHIERIVGNTLYAGEVVVPIGREYKKEVYSRLNIAGLPSKQ